MTSIMDLMADAELAIGLAHDIRNRPMDTRERSYCMAAIASIEKYAADIKAAIKPEYVPAYTDSDWNEFRRSFCEADKAVRAAIEAYKKIQDIPV